MPSARSVKTLSVRSRSTSRITTSANAISPSDARQRRPQALRRVNGAWRNYWNAVEKSEYRERVKLAVEHLHNCRAQWAGTAPVREVFQGKTIWQGEVEIYDLTGHPKAKRCYAWAHREGPNDE